MFVGVLHAEFRIPGARSLKERRGPVRSLKDRLRERFRCAVAEVGETGRHQRAQLGLGLVGSDAAELQRRIDELRRALERDPALQCLGVRTAFVPAADLFAGGRDFDDPEAPPENLLFLD